MLGSRLAMETDVPTDTKTCERMEDAVAVQAEHANRCSANQVYPDPMCLTSFGDDSTEPPALPCTRDGALIDNGAAAPKSCLSPVEMRTPTAAGGLRPGTASTAMMTIFPQPIFSWNFGETKKYTSRINYNLGPSWRRVIQTKSRQTLMFNPGGFTSSFCACPFLRTWRALLFGERFVRALDVAGVFFGRMKTLEYHFRSEVQATSTYCGRSPFLRNQADTGNRQSPTTRGYRSWGDGRMSGNAMERGA